ncbi:MAG: hypothetical protein ACYTDX_11510, partial [Planctomycetota bacterium]
TFTAFEPHATGKVLKIKCVVPSNEQKIAWAATLQYRAYGDLSDPLLKKGELYIQARIFRQTEFTTHDKAVSHRDWRVIEYFRLAILGSAELLDDHAEREDYPPLYTTGTCRIRSRTRIELRLYVLPNGRDAAFGTPKMDAAGNELPGFSGKGDAKKTAEQSKGKRQLVGWKAKVWVAEYEMLTDHCGQLFLYEPKTPAIPTGLTGTSGARRPWIRRTRTATVWPAALSDEDVESDGPVCRPRSADASRLRVGPVCH